MKQQASMISAIWLFSAVFIGAISGQQTAPAQPSEIVLPGSTREVLLDFVVRDKHQREVKDIRPDEAEIFEDGARQTLKSFQYRTGKDAQPATAGGSHNTGQPLKLDPLCVRARRPQKSPSQRREDWWLNYL